MILRIDRLSPIEALGAALDPSYAIATMASVDRRQFIAAATALGVPRAAGAAGHVEASWPGLAAAWRLPEWFRDAKFGIWAHWSAQCVPEQGDWYGRFMYQQGHPIYTHHLRTYGHPADTGFMEIENRWHAEAWDPADLIRRYKAAGARYFVALACHHDNLDTFASRHHAWNATRVGPRRDIIGGWEKVARAKGLRFGVSNHSSHAWHWWQTAYGYDAEGARAGERYDAFRLTRAMGKGKWWEGLDPQELYTGPNISAPAGISSIKAMDAWHDAHDGQWLETAPPRNPAFAAKWLLRQNDLVDRYRPDLVYFDDLGLPFGQAGLDAAAHYYTGAIAATGSADVVLTAKLLNDAQRRAITEDIERGWSDRLRAEPWQTCTCIGDWHYNRARFDQKSYVPAKQVIQRLADIVSKNGNLLLSIPVRGNGTIDSEEERILDGITAWMRVNGDAIHGSRPWRVYGEGPTKVASGALNEGRPVFTPQDVRFTTKRGALNAILLEWPDTVITVASLAGRRVERATLSDGRTVGVRNVAHGLELTLPPAHSGEFVPVIRLEGAGLI